MVYVHVLNHDSAINVVKYVCFLLLLCRHTGVVCYGKEFFFGGGGIEYCLPVNKNLKYCMDMSFAFIAVCDVFYLIYI